MADGDGGTRVTGTLTSWNDDRGFGFLTTDVGDRRVFVHISAFPRSAARPLLGEALSFEIETADDGRSVARRVNGERMAQSASSPPEPPAAPRRTTIQRVLAGRRPASFDYLAIIGFFLVYVFVSVQWPMPPWVLGVYLLTSVLSFIVYAVDKRAATSGGWRISESSLLALGIIGGWPGAIVGQQVFRHKTRKRGFRSAFWGTVVLNVLAFVTFSVVLSERLQGTF
ncbi:DUF1294 domain-containing protein [Glaciihabitans sp. INWT7]|uniref:cold shock and DUF1294 domain-containing protein n=1 Tax=Glaciihabitans sp. INWT7 TaxID=2596912 RepID=UPI001629BA68|nr:cold shock and DUF1294 domain-containing protein [Glaciihabitans sp. INWT7]QNE46384.1 DUF1294 domain-containing protein [Glaciihabitans sp. INWT7]